MLSAACSRLFEINTDTESKRKNRKQKLLFAAALGICLFLYYLIYLNKAFPLAEGWHSYYAELMRAGNVPYRDFFYYLPPLNLVIDPLLWSLSFGSMLVFRILRLLERIAMMEVVFFMLSKYYDHKIVFVACFFAGLIGGGNTYDLMGDYNQTAEFLIILTALFAIRFAEEPIQKIKYRKLAIAGVFLGLIFLCKQSTGAISIMLYALFLCLWCFWNKDKKFGWYILAAFIGVICPIAIAAIILACLGALPAAIQQIFFGASSKGGLGTMLFRNIASFYWASLVRFWIIFLGIALFVLCLILYKRYIKKHPQPAAIKKAKLLFVGIPLGALLIAAVILVIVKRGVVFGMVATLAKSIIFPIFLVLVIAAIVTYIVLSRSQNAKTQSILGYMAVVVPIIIAFVGFALLLFANPQFAISISQTPTVGLKDVFSQLLVIFTTAFLFVGIVLCLVKREQVVPIQLLICALAVFSSLYSAFMAAGATAGDMPLRVGYFAFPLAFCMLLNCFKKWKVYAYSALIALCLISSFSVLALKASAPYSWWGYHEDPLYTKTEAVDVPGLEGFRLSEKEKTTYEEVYKVVMDNTSEESVVLGFPYVKIFNQLTGHIDEVGFVPVHYFDVCPDNYAAADAKTIAETPPDIIIWHDVGTSCWDVHEALFRKGGRMGQRDIQDWFISVKDSKYQVIGQVGDLYIYKLKDNGVPIGYTYFEDDLGDKNNVTASDIIYSEKKEQ
ncbi:MAG: hypothetical protein E7653_02270 [Ruminococcaceae bacterium]|nr:hypothetical protein [Oscillospiraceae bacterium]